MPTSDLVSMELSLQDGIGTASGHGALRVTDIVLAHIFLTDSLQVAGETIASLVVPPSMMNL